MKMQNPITLQQQRKVWTIHQSVNGVTYYYNRSTKKSQYQMPQCFKITEQDLDHPDWKQYRTAEGKKFYYNALTRKSCWHMPAQVKQWKMKMQDQKRLERQRNGDKQEQMLSQADQIKRKFMLLLKNKLININTKWDVCIKLCQDDQRWNLLKMSDKKRYFTQYIAQLKKLSELQLRAKTQANKVQFIKMLKEHKNLNSDCKMHKVQFQFNTDPRWRILDGVDKQNAFQDYLDELLVKEKQQARNEKQRNIQNLKILLQQNQIKYDMRWQQFKNQFKDFQCYKKLHELDRINTFTKYIIQAQQRNQQKQKKEKRMKQRTDRVQFRNMIKLKLYNGQITYKTKWRSFVKQLKDDVRLINMMDPQHKGSSAHQIFQNFMDGIKKNHKVFKSQIKSHFKKINFRMTQQTPYHQFQQKLNDLTLYAQAKPIYKQYFYYYFKQKIKSKNAAKQQKQKEKQRQKQAALKKAQKKEKKAIFKIFKQYNQNTKSKYAISNHIQKIQQNLSEQNIKISHQNIFNLADGQDDKKSRDSNSKSQKPKSKSRSSSSSRSKSKSQKKKKKKKQDQRSKQKQRDKDREKEKQRQKQKQRQRQRQRQREKERQRQKQRQRQRQRDKEKEQLKNKQKISLINTSIVKSISIPSELRNQNNDNECQEEGQIKQDQFPEQQIKKQLLKKQPQKQKQKEKEKQKSLDRQKSKQKKKKKSAKKRKGSSSSDSD